MFVLMGVVAVWTSVILGYTKTRAFVRNRLRYVDAVHKPFVPFKVGVVAAAVTLPIAWIVTFVSTGAAFLIGTSVGWGVAAGRRDIRNRHYLASSYN